MSTGGLKNEKKDMKYACYYSHLLSYIHGLRWTRRDVFMDINSFTNKNFDNSISSTYKQKDTIYVIGIDKYLCHGHCAKLSGSY